MSALIGNIRTFKTAHFTVRVDAVEEDSPDLSFDETGETQTKVQSGEWRVFAVRVRVFHDRMGVIAEEWLGNCIYADIAEFQDHRECGAQTRKLRAEGSNAICGSYFADMITTACAAARETIRDAQSIKVRV